MRDDRLRRRGIDFGCRLEGGPKGEVLDNRAMHG